MKDKPILQMKKKTQSEIDEISRQRLEAYNKKMQEGNSRTNKSSFVAHPLPQAVAALDEKRVPRWLINKFHDVNATSKWPFYLWGKVGRGKTCASAYFYCAWPEPAMWMNFKVFCDRTAQLERVGELTYYDEQQRYHEHTRESWWGSIARTGLFVLDDVGVGEASNSRTEALWSLLEARIGKPLVLTGNLTLDELHLRFDGRVISRMYAGTDVELSGPDQRTQNHQARHFSGDMEDLLSEQATQREMS